VKKPVSLCLKVRDGKQLSFFFAPPRRDAAFEAAPSIFITKNKILRL